jgi:hypothetical protein
MRRYRPRKSGIQLGLYQPRVELPEWSAFPTESRQIVKTLLVELLKEAAVLLGDEAAGAQESADE